MRGTCGMLIHGAVIIRMHRAIGREMSADLGLRDGCIRRLQERQGYAQGWRERDVGAVRGPYPTVGDRAWGYRGP